MTVSTAGQNARVIVVDGRALFGSFASRFYTSCWFRKGTEFLIVASTSCWDISLYSHVLLFCPGQTILSSAKSPTFFSRAWRFISWWSCHPRVRDSKAGHLGFAARRRFYGRALRVSARYSPLRPATTEGSRCWARNSILIPSEGELLSPGLMPRIFIHKVPRALQPASNFAPAGPIGEPNRYARCWSYFFR